METSRKNAIERRSETPAKSLSSRHTAVDPRRMKSRWFHPLLVKPTDRKRITTAELDELAGYYFKRFLPFFRNRPEGSLADGVVIEFTRKMRQKLGLAYLFEHKIRLNEAYFAEDPALLPYTLFHEMTHLWLYDCMFDPGHTHRFYRKMNEFNQTGLPLDPDVHIHTRVAAESKFVYVCPNCRNRWYVREKLSHSIYCGHCFERDSVEFYADLMPTTVVDKSA